MSERDKQTARDIIEAYRRRQKLTLNIILGIGVLIILLAVGLIFLPRLTGPALSPVEQNTQTPALTGTQPVTASATEPLRPTDPLSPVTSETQVLDETPLSPETTTYEVQEGDTLALIALRFNIDLQTLLSLNPDIDPDLISIGQQIVIPAVQTGTGTATSIPEGFSDLIEYQVVSGDTLFGIAERFNSSVNAIVAENNLENANDIRAGDVLQIPVNATPSPPAPTVSTPEATTTQSP